jgi:hypothetical protein
MLDSLETLVWDTPQFILRFPGSCLHRWTFGSISQTFPDFIPDFALRLSLCSVLSDLRSLHFRVARKKYLITVK